MNLVENERNLEEYESISDSIDESSTDNGYDDISINTNSLEENWDESQIYPELNVHNLCLVTPGV